MPCYLLTLTKQTSPQSLADLIRNQYPPYPPAQDITTAVNYQTPGIAPPTSCAQINVWAHTKNVDKRGDPIGIKYGDANLSGIRYALVLNPGDYMRWEIPGKGVSTLAKYFLLDEGDDAQLGVELLTE